MDAWGWMVAPTAACAVIALALSWFGLHVLQRGVIFVDLALAQIAALGTTWMVMAGHEPDDPISYAAALLATFAGAIAFSLTRLFARRVPQEALIGIAYVVSAAAGVLLIELADDPHGGEKIQHLLVGNVVWVRWSEIGLMAAVAAGVGVLHFLVRRPLLACSFDPDRAEAEGYRVAAWDVVFYLTFGLVITAIVHVAGVLLVFSYLVIPAVIARLFADGVAARLGIALAVALPVSIGGVAISYEHSAGPVIVTIMGAVLLVALVVHALRTAERPAARLGRIALGAAVLALALVALHRVGAATAEHDHEGHEHAEHHAEAAGGTGQAAAGAAVDEAWIRAHLDDAAALAGALPGLEDPSLRLLVGIALARLGDARGLDVLAHLAADAPPFLRMEASDALSKVLGDPPEGYDPLASPTDGWLEPAAHPPEGWQDRARGLELP